MLCVRFRTLGCYPLTAAIEFGAKTVEDIIRELFVAKQSERVGRIIDHVDLQWKTKNVKVIFDACCAR